MYIYNYTYTIYTHIIIIIIIIIIVIIVITIIITIIIIHIYIYTYCSCLNFPSISHACLIHFSPGEGPIRSTAFVDSSNGFTEPPMILLASTAALQAELPTIFSMFFLLRCQ